MKRKVCIATPEFPPAQWGGLARTVERVARHAEGMGLETHVAHFTVEQNPLVLLDENRQSRSVDGVVIHHITVGREPMSGATRDLWDCPHTLTLRMMYQSLELLHQDEGFDLFHSFFLYPVGFVTGVLARRSGRPSVATLLGNDIKKYLFSPEKVGVCKIGLENADRVVALSSDLLETAHAVTPVMDKGRIIYNSVDIPARSWEPRKRDGAAFRLGCAGIFKYAKGLPYLLKAVGELHRNGSVELEILGELRSAEKHVFETMVQRTGVKEILRFREPLSHDKISEWLISLDAFILPSVSEGCPNILMEAMAAGLPCVATRVGAVEDLMEHGVSGLMARWGDSHALARAVAEIIDDPALAERLGEASRERMKEFSSSRERREWEEIYRQLIEF